MGKGNRENPCRRAPASAGRGIWLATIALFVALLFAFPLPFTHCPFSFSARAERNDYAVVSTSTREGRLAVFDDVWQTVRDRYYDANFHGVDWLAQRSVLRSRAADAEGPQELYAVLRHLLAALMDAHTRVYAPAEKFDWQHPRFVSIGISLRAVEGLPTVVAVDHGSTAARAGVRPGDVIESVDGEPAASVLERRRREQLGSSTPQAARSHALAFLLAGAPDTNVQVGWRTSGNKAKSASFRRDWRERHFALRIRQPRGDYPVVEIDAFTWTIARDFSRALREELSRARGLVLDLRNNGGGDAEAMAGVASYFLPTATGLGEFTNRSGNVALSLETQVWSPVSASSHAPIDIPIVILTSDRTSSAAEILVAALKDAKRATVIGAETCGCVLAIRSRHALPDGGQLDVSELDYRTAQHVRLEGHGIMPDENIILSRRDLYSGRDRVLGSALARLKGRAAGEKPIPPLASYPDQDKLQEMLASGLMFNSISLYNILVDSESSGAKFEAKGMKKIRDRPAYAGSR